MFDKFGSDNFTDDCDKEANKNTNETIEITNPLTTNE